MSQDLQKRMEAAEAALGLLAMDAENNERLGHANKTAIADLRKEFEELRLECRTILKALNQDMAALKKGMF